MNYTLKNEKLTATFKTAGAELISLKFNNKKEKYMPIKIYIDQGHNPGSINAGASGNGLVEAEVTYQAGVYLKELLDTNCNFEVRLSRNSVEEVLGTNTRESLQERVEMANDWSADYFISIHVNANTNTSISGTEVYVYATNTVASNLAYDVLNGIVEVAKTRDNGVYVNPLFYVLRNTTMPAILVELGYLTNIEDANLLRNDLFLFSLGMYVGILRFFGYIS